MLICGTTKLDIIFVINDSLLELTMALNTIRRIIAIVRMKQIHQRIKKGSWILMNPRTLFDK